MRSSVIVLVLVFLALFSTERANGQDRMFLDYFNAQSADQVEAPEFASEDFPGTITAFSEFRHWDGKEGDIGWSRLRITAGQRWGFQVELGLQGVDDPHFENSNMVQRATVWRKLNNWTFSLGRQFLAAGYSTPAPGLFRTARYPNPFPWGFYGYGVQAEGPVGAWRLRTDVGGMSGLQYNSGGQLDRLEVSVRASKQVGLNRFGLSGQVSEDFLRGGMDTTLLYRSFSLTGGVFYAEDTNLISGFGLLEWYPHPWISPHLQLEEQADGTPVGTVGVGLGDPSSVLYFVTDVDDRGEFSFRAQLRMRKRSF